MSNNVYASKVSYFSLSCCQSEHKMLVLILLFLFHTHLSHVQQFKKALNLLAVTTEFEVKSYIDSSETAMV